MDAGWELIWQQTLPRQQGDQVLGGYSAMELDWPSRRLWLISDAKRTHSLELNWGGTLRRPQFQLQPLQPLMGQGKQKLDGEALVRLPDQPSERFWMASEARSAKKRPAALLELVLQDSGGFSLKNRWPLPAKWQPADAQGMRRNKGPEAVVALPGKRLLLAAEAPLQQDPPHQLRLLLAQLNQGELNYSTVGTPLLVSPVVGAKEHWGLTALLPVRPGINPPLLALWRGYAEPDQWWNRLSLLPAIPLDERPRRPLAPLMRWDLRQLGLEPDNWEALTTGPQLEDGRPTLLLASDDNFSPFQQSRLALLAPLQPEPCSSADSR